MTTFLAQPSPRMPAPPGIPGSLRYGAISLTVHAVMVATLILLVRGPDGPDSRPRQSHVTSVTPIAKLVFLEAARREEPAQGGGGGGGYKEHGPVRRA